MIPMKAAQCCMWPKPFDCPGINALTDLPGSSTYVCRPHLTSSFAPCHNHLSHSRSRSLERYHTDTPTSILLDVVIRLLAVHQRSVVTTQRPVPLRADSTSSLPGPDHQGGVGPAHREQGRVVLSPADVGHLGAVAHVTLKTSILTLKEEERKSPPQHYLLIIIPTETEPATRSYSSRVAEQFEEAEVVTGREQRLVSGE